jgi:pyruvate kinase
VYNSLCLGANAFLLSAETSNGHDPVAAVHMLSEIIRRYQCSQPS